MDPKAKIRVAHLSGPNATIQNTPPLITSNKARLKHGLPPMKDEDGSVVKHDPLRQQRLAAPVKVYIEQFSAHPLEADAGDHERALALIEQGLTEAQRGGQLLYEPCILCLRGDILLKRNPPEPTAAE